MKRLFATVGIIGLAVGVATGEPGAPAPAKAQPAFAEQVAKLGSDDYREREDAVAALEQAGPAALPALRAATKSDDPEVRRRAIGLLVRLQRASDSADKLVAKKVALNYADTPIGTAINDLRTRTGLNITIDMNRIADPLRKVTCVTGELPVWEALDKFCAAAGLREAFAAELEVPKVQPQGRRAYVPPAQVPNPDAVPVVLIDGKGHAPGSRGSAVRVLALPPSFPGHRTILGTGEITLCFDVTPLPGLNWQDASAVKISKVIDDAGRAGSAAFPRRSNEVIDVEDIVFAGPGMRGGWGGRFDMRGYPINPEALPNPRVVPVSLKLATPGARALKRLEGVVVGEITLTNQPLITVIDPEKNFGSTFDGPGGVRLTVVGKGNVKAAGPTLELSLSYPSFWAYGGRRGWGGFIDVDTPRGRGQTPTIQVYDAAGKVLTPQRNINPNNFPNDDGMTTNQTYLMQFGKDSAAPAKIVVTGSRPMIVEVPFVMENVPLP